MALEKGTRTEGAEGDVAQMTDPDVLAHGVNLRSLHI